MSEKYNWGIKPNALKISSNTDGNDIKDSPSLLSRSSQKNKYKSYSSDSYNSRLGGKSERDRDLPPRKYENNYILGANLHDRQPSYSNSEVTNSPYLKDSPYLTSNKKILYSDDYDGTGISNKSYTSKNLMFDTEELGKELDNLLDHIRTTRNNTSYGLFDKKYKYSKSYSYGNPSSNKDTYGSISSSQRVNSLGSNQDYKSYSSLSSKNKSYYSPSYLMNNDRDSKYGKSYIYIYIIIKIEFNMIIFQMLIFIINLFVLLLDSYTFGSSGSGSKKKTTDSPLRYYNEPLRTPKQSSYNSNLSSKINDDLYSLNNYNLNQSQALNLTNKSEALLQEHRAWLK